MSFLKGNKLVKFETIKNAILESDIEKFKIEIRDDTLFILGNNIYSSMIYCLLFAYGKTDFMRVIFMMLKEQKITNILNIRFIYIKYAILNNRFEFLKSKFIRDLHIKNVRIDSYFDIVDRYMISNFISEQLKEGKQDNIKFMINMQNEQSDYSNVFIGIFENNDYSKCEIMMNELKQLK